MSHTYHNIYGMSLTGLRFFTVYGPWGRPDMAAFKFAKNILMGENITVFQVTRRLLPRRAYSELTCAEATSIGAYLHLCQQDSWAAEVLHPYQAFGSSPGLLFLILCTGTDGWLAGMDGWFIGHQKRCLGLRPGTVLPEFLEVSAVIAAPGCYRVRTRRSCRGISRSSTTSWPASSQRCASPSRPSRARPSTRRALRGPARAASACRSSRL